MRMRWRTKRREGSQSGARGPQSMRLTGQLLRALGAEDGEDGEGPWDFEVLIARPGPSRDGSWFLPEAVLRAAAPLFEGAQAFANHAEGKGPDIKNLVGWHRQVRMTEEGLVSVFAVSKSAAWFQAMANDALARGIAEPFGFSFDVMAEAEFIEGEGGRVLHFQKIIAVNSVDVVHKGRLGGALLGRAAAGVSDVEEKMLDKVFQKLRAVAPGAAEKLGEGWTPGQLLAACEEAGLEWSLDGKGKMEEAAAREQGLTARLAASALPEPVQEKVRDQFRGTDFTEAEVAAAIRREAVVLEKLTASGALSGYGARAQVIEDEVDRKQAALDGLFDPAGRPQNGHRPYRFLGEAFQDFTGQRLTPQRFFAEACHYHRASEDWNGIRRLSASLTTATWGQAFGDSIRRAMLRDFRDDRFQSWRKVASSVVPVRDFRTNRRIRVGGYGDLATVAEQADYPQLTSPADEEVTYAVAKRGGIEDLTWEMVQNDDIGAVRKIPERLARAASRTLNKFVFDFLSGNGLIYDGVALFDAAHGNTAADALTYPNVITGIKAMGQQNFFGESGVEAGAQARPKYLLHTTELIEEAFDVTQPPVKVVSAENSTQPSMIHRLGVEPLWVPEFTDANDWFLVADPSLIDTVEIGFLEDQQDPELFIEDNPVAGSAFSADKIRYKIRHVYGGAVLDFRGFYRGAPA